MMENDTEIGSGPGEGPIATLLVDSNPIFREGLRRILLETRYRPVQSATCVESAIRLGRDGFLPALIVVSTDHPAPGELRLLKDRYPLSRIVLLIDSFGSEAISEILRSGVDSLVIKSIPCDAFLKSLDLVVDGTTILALGLGGFLGLPNGLGKPIERPGIGEAAHVGAEALRDLSDREQRVLSCLLDGASNKTIARALGITESTVKVHVKSILRKTHMRNRTQVALWAVSHPAGGTPGVRKSPEADENPNP